MCVPCRSPSLTLKIVPVWIAQYIANCIYLRVSSYCSLYVQFDRMQHFCLQHVGRALRFYMLHSLTHAFAPFAPFTPFASPFRHFVLHVLPPRSFHSPCVPKNSVIQQSDQANLQFFYTTMKICVLNLCRQYLGTNMDKCGSVVRSKRHDNRTCFSTLT